MSGSPCSATLIIYRSVELGRARVRSLSVRLQSFNLHRSSITPARSPCTFPLPRMCYAHSGVSLKLNCPSLAWSSRASLPPRGEEQRAFYARSRNCVHNPASVYQDSLPLSLPPRGCPSDSSSLYDNLLNLLVGITVVVPLTLLSSGNYVSFSY